MPDLLRWSAEGAIEPEDDGARRWLAATAGRWRAFAATGELALLLRDGEPAHPPPPGAARAVLAGDLAAMAPPDVAAIIYQEKRTGTLFTASGAAQRHLFFREGQLTWAASSAPGERFGEVALRNAFITAAQLQQATRDAASSRRIGQRLVDLGHLTADQLFHAIQAQVMEIFSSWILCASGAFLLTDDPGEAGKASKISLDTQQLLFDGVRRIDEMQHWRERIPTALVIISTTGKRPSSALEPLEQEALALIDGARSLEDVQRALAATEYDATRAIHRLIEKGLATAEAPARAGDEFEITATVETGDDGVEPAERAAQINAALAEVFDWINKTSDPGHFKLSMDSFLASESKKRPALKGLHLRADGTIDEALFLANLEIQKGSVADLEEVVSFAMFEAGELLDPERESKVERAVGKRLARIR